MTRDLSHRTQPPIALIVTVLGLVSAAAAVVVSRRVFPFLSINNDEAINRLFADSLAHGHLFPPTKGLPEAFRPWLTAVSGDHYVFKYTPLVPAMMAVSQVVTGGTELYLAAVAGATVVMTYLVAVEVLKDRAEAVVAVALLALSPLVLVQSALHLSYLPALLFLEVFVWALLRGLSERSGVLVAVSGLALSLAFVARSYDAVVFAVPLLVWAVLWGRRRGGGALDVPKVLAFTLPGAATMIVFLAFNRAATGSPFGLPFALLEGQDTFGFGIRRLYPTDQPHDFGLREGVTGALQHSALLNVWAAGGTIVLLLALITVVRRRIEGPAWALAVVALLLPLSYVVFWGPWNATVVWGGTDYVGPFYFLPVLLPLALLGARGLMDAVNWRPAVGVALAGAMAVVTVVALVPIVDGNLAFTRNSRALDDFVTRGSEPALVFASMPTPFLMHPLAVIANRWDLSGPVIYAVEQGVADLDTLRVASERTPYRLQFRTAYRDPDEPFGARLEQLRLVTGQRIEMGLEVDASTQRGPVRLSVFAGGRTREYVLGSRAAAYRERLVVDSTGPSLVGRSPAAEREEPQGTGLEIEFMATEAYAPSKAIERVRVPFRTTSSGVEALVPTGRVWTTGRLAPPRLSLTG